MSDIDKFRNAFKALTTCYPHARTETMQAVTYWRVLEKYSLDCILKAMAKVPAAHPEFFPSVGQLEIIAKAEARGVAVRAEADETRKRFPLPEQPKQRLIGPPSDPDAIEAYIAGGETRFEKLARYWECETRRLGLNSGQPTPEKLGARRWELFWQTWNKETGEVRG